MRKFNLFFGLTTVIFLTGCSTVGTSPSVGVDLKAQLDRDDIEILDNVEGSSETVSFFMGLIQTVRNGSEPNLIQTRIFGISLFEDNLLYDQYTSLNPTSARAYFDAIHDKNEADAFIHSRFIYKTHGFPLLFKTEKVDYRGKAILIKDDEVR